MFRVILTSSMKNYWIKKVTAFTIGWIIALVLWRVLRRVGVNDTYLAVVNVTTTPLTVLIILLCISIFAGLIFGSVQYAYESYSIKSVSFREFILKALFGHLVLMLVLYFLLYVGLKLTGVTGVSQKLSFMEFLSHPVLLVYLFYSILVNSAIILLIQINKLLGKGNLAKLVTGKFHTPREEITAFMFLDLMGSTTIAEKLGHFKYSRFIQDCFYDLSVVDPYNAHIYQYVGDEVVLTWKVHEEEQLDNCIHAFNAFTHALESKAEYYQSEYGVQPIFKAGLHLGPVTVVEVGNLKREIAYHGDTINVAARIQEQCKTFDRTLLISDDIYERVKNMPDFSFENVGDFVLRGRKKSTQLYGVTPH